MTGFFLLWEFDNEQKSIWMNDVVQYFAGEPMLLPDYAKLFCNSGEYAVCAKYQGTNGLLIYPFIFRPIPINTGEDLFDITTPYGYGGPRIFGDLSVDERNWFWDRLDDWMLEHSIISEFIRFMLWGAEDTAYRGIRETRSTNIVRSLEDSLDNIWMNFDHKVRKNVKKANAAGLKMLIDDNGERIDDFLSIYYSTMDRRNANKTYYFDTAFFNELHTSMKGHFVYFYAMQNNTPISVELVLAAKDNIYSYLGGTNLEYYCCRPNDFIKYEIIKWAKENGKKRFVLGGGYQPGDGIFRYKKSLAPDGTVEFQIGRRIVNEGQYAMLVAKCNEQRARQGKPLLAVGNSFFPLYRVH